VELNGSIAIVTGASSGIGAATARALAGAGATVVTVARRADRLEEVAGDCRRHTPASYAHPMDVADPEACTHLVKEVEDGLGRIDILVNNAGIPMRRHALDLTLADIRGPLEVNYLGAVQLALAALPGMVARRRGSIINVTSVSGYVPVPRAASYGATKAALSRFTHGLAIDLAGTGVHAGVVSPGPIATEIWDRGPEGAQYQGKLYPPEVVAADILRSVERGRTHVTSPRQYGAMGALYPLVGRVLRTGLRRFGRSSQPRRRADH
jgi:short-subunit dehydrogenase